MKKVALGLSGGVDSSVCAHLLLQQSYNVTAVYLECFNEAGCRSDEDRADATAVAEAFGIPFVSLDFKTAYQDKVLSYFYQAYEKGETPNPDLICNREIKFGLFFNWAMENGFDFIATGHYAKITTVYSPADSSLVRQSVLAHKSSSIQNQSQFAQHFLTIPADTHKDQTYFLSLLTQEQLAKTIFPLAQMQKKEVRTLATQLNLPTAHKKDSTGVCFVGEFNLRDFLSQKIALTSGNVVDSNGHVIGSHRGVAAYTLGQRHGFTIHNQTPDTAPLYVIGKDIKKNQLIVGDREATARTQIVLHHFHAINGLAFVSNLSATQKNSVFLRVRHTGELTPCHLEINQATRTYICHLSAPVYGVGAGQFGVLYIKGATLLPEFDKETVFCLGAGEIV